MRIDIRLVLAGNYRCELPRQTQRQVANQARGPILAAAQQSRFV